MKLKTMTQAAVFAALIFVVTRFLQIPIPLGYFNIGNVVILIGCLLLPNPYGVYAAAIGSALADLTSYPVYTIPTLVIKALFPLLFYFLLTKLADKKFGTLIDAAIVTLIPLFGYTIVGGVLYGGLMAGLAQFPGLLAEYAANLVLFGIVYKQAEKLKKYL